MNCRKCEAHLSAFIDKELDPRTAGEVSRHLDSCPGCREREAGLNRLRTVLSGLPAYRMTPAEQDNLMEGVRQEMRQVREKKAQAHARLYPRVAAGAAILVTAVVVTLALMSTPVSRETATTEETPAIAMTEEERNATWGEEDFSEQINSNLNGSTTAGITNGTQLSTLSMVPTPRLVTSTTDYDKSQVADYSKDLGTRLDFYSDIWYQPAASGTAVASGTDQPEVREYCLDSLLDQAQASGEDPASLQAALSVISSQKPSAGKAIPCFVEKAYYRGQPVWIISFSTPEDAQLFTNPEIASLVNLARQLYVSGDLSASALMEGLTANMAPGSTYNVSTLNQEARETTAIGLEELINELAKDNNLVSYLRQLAALDADKLVSLVAQGSGLPVEFSSISSSLLDMLTWRVWVVGTEDGQVLSRPSR